MELLIHSLSQAYDFKPIKPTYAIRIHPTIDPQISYTSQRYDLLHSDSYLHIAEYTFDDNQDRPMYFEMGPTWFNESIAQKIIDDFKKYKEKTECLLSHCSRGQNRSPAVAIALNELFELGNDTKELKRRYSEYNRHTYRILIEVGERS